MNSLYNRINHTLEQLLQGSKYKIEPSPPKSHPLFLLLTVKPNLVCFAALNGQPKENFSQAFHNFKNMYSVHSSEWADFDLILVLCKTDTDKVKDDFCNKIEMDPYFCRKFVIDVAGNLENQIGRLPFIPLRPENIVGLKRPISAQTLLMNYGVKSELARYLAVPHARGIEKIIEESLEGELGKPRLIEAKGEEFISPSLEVKRKIGIKQLEINNFRSYRGNYMFDLNADLIVLFGPNGLGKTSFFDAIDFVCTGGVARFDERYGRKTERVLNTLKHLDSSIDDSFIKASLYIDNHELQLERQLKSRTKAYVNEHLKNRTKTLMDLTGVSQELLDLRIENFVRLFRATHLFGQEYQFLTSELREYSKLPRDTVSRMLAFQDYVEAINKSKKLSKELERQIREKKSKISFLKSSLEAKRSEFDELSRSSKTFEIPETIYSLGKQIAERITREADILIDIPKEFSREIIQEWKTKIAVQLSTFTQYLSGIDKLIKRFPELVSQRKIIEKKLKALNQRKELLNEISVNYLEKKSELEKHEENLKKLLFDERNFSSIKDNLNWLLKTRNEYYRLREQATSEEDNYRKLKKKLLDLIPKIEELKSEIKASEDTFSKNTLVIKDLETKQKELKDFEKTKVDWQKALNEQKKQKEDLHKLEQEFLSVKNKLRSEKSRLNNSELAKDRNKQHLDSLQRSQAELKTLLDNIEKYIHNNICPVCGTQHKTKEELIKKLRAQRGIQSKEIQEALKLFEIAKSNVADLNKIVRELELQLEQLDQKIIEMKKEAIRIDLNIEFFEERSNSLDLPSNPENLEVFIESIDKELSEKTKIKRTELFELKSNIKKKKEELEDLVKYQGSLDRNIKNIEIKKRQLQKEIEKIINDASDRQVSLDLEEDKIKQELKTASNNMTRLGKKIEIKQSENQNLKKETSNLQEKRDKASKEILELDEEISESKNQISEVEKLIYKLDFKPNIEQDQIQIIKKDAEEKLYRLESLKSELINFEIALDSVETSATLSKIQSEIANITRQFKNLTKEQNLLNDWHSYFNDVRDELELLQHRALKEYTSKYGPLTSTIQKRLRAVYGFGDIELHPEKGEILVRVERKGKRNFIPSDYFSESQIQIVMLSLFMSAALTQTWSSFAPILLDDPVEHFDDLNAYSFLDLIRGLIMEHRNEHQFIISTCEDRLYHLMRQKFNKMNGRVIYYVFESIGENGPKIVKS